MNMWVGIIDCMLIIYCIVLEPVKVEKGSPAAEAVTIIREQIQSLITMIYTKRAVPFRAVGKSTTSAYITISSKILVLFQAEVDDPCIARGIIPCRWITDHLDSLKIR